MLRVLGFGILGFDFSFFLSISATFYWFRGFGVHMNDSRIFQIGYFNIFRDRIVGFRGKLVIY